MLKVQRWFGCHPDHYFHLHADSWCQPASEHPRSVLQEDPPLPDNAIASSASAVSDSKAAVHDVATTSLTPVVSDTTPGQQMALSFRLAPAQSISPAMAPAGKAPHTLTTRFADGAMSVM